MKKKKESYCASADAISGKQRIIKTNSTEFLTPSSNEPKNRQVDQNRQCRAGFDNETAGTFTNAIGSETGKRFGARRKARQQRPRTKTRLPQNGSIAYEMDHPREN
ncbi:MAG TPA: hypothetical protein VLQ29_07700 [Candidatus Dormibacteraeota bacterium]|nr:hypothetical protein [Candidatus Dormibacteraeota bacterium]